MQSLLVLMLVFNVMAIQNGPSRPSYSEDDQYNQGRPQEHQASHGQGYRPPYSEDDQPNHGYEEDQESSEDDTSNVNGSQDKLIFPNATKNGLHNLQRHQGSHLKVNKALHFKEDHLDQAYDNSGEGQDSSGDDTSNVEGSKGNNSLIFPTMSSTTVNPTKVKYDRGPILYPSADSTRSPPGPPLLQPFKPSTQYPTTQSPNISPSLEQSPQVTATHNANGIPSLTATPPLPSPQNQLNNPSSHPESPKTVQSSPAFMNECVCTPFFRCHDKETSSNLTNVVNDRTFIPASACQITEKTCPNPNDVCCCNMDPPSSSTSKSLSHSQAPSPFDISKSQAPIHSEISQSQAPIHSEISQSQASIHSEISTSNDKCDCRPSNDCHDYIEMDRTLEKGHCNEPNHVCCHDIVLAVTTPSLETSTLSPNPEHQSPIPSEESQSASTGECKCTPFFNCFDPETSSNLTNVVNDRININQCPNSNDVCCHNRTPPSEVAETEVHDFPDCIGTCMHIEFCPGLSETHIEAQSGNSEAVKKLRKSVCSKKRDFLWVCCPQ